MDAEAEVTRSVTYDYRGGCYLTLIDGRLEEVHLDLWDFIESLDGLSDRMGVR